MGPPGVAAAAAARLDFQTVKDRSEEAVQIGERLHPMRGAEPVIEGLAEDSVSEKIDERVRLGVDVVTIEQHLGKIDDFLQAPGEWLDVADEIGMGAQWVEIHAVRLERGVELDTLERLGRHLEQLVAVPVCIGQIARLIEETEVRPFDVEA